MRIIIDSNITEIIINAQKKNQIKGNKIKNKLSIYSIDYSMNREYPKIQ